MSSSVAVGAEASPKVRLEQLFDELSELTGQRNAIDGRIVDIVAEIDRGNGLWGNTGCRSIAALVAWKTGVSSRNAETIVAVAHRVEEFPRCVEGLREGRFSLDQVGVIAERAGAGSDEHYVELVEVATVNQLRTAVKLEPRPDADPRPDPDPQVAKTRTDAKYTAYRIVLPTVEAAKFDAALATHHDALIADWKRDRDATGQQPSDVSPAFPTLVDGFMSVVEASWDAEATRRPHGARTTVVMHVDVKDRVAALHLGPVLSQADRQYLSCDATCEAWFHRDGQPIGAGRTTRTISRRLRRALEHRHPTCAVPGCGATRGLHAHHIIHWEHGGATELNNLVLLCPYHHRLHHRGAITITGPADRLKVTNDQGEALVSGSLARPPTRPPPDVPPCNGPTGERADWWWYTPFQPQPPPSTN